MGTNAELRRKSLEGFNKKTYRPNKRNVQAYMYSKVHEFLGDVPTSIVDLPWINPVFCLEMYKDAGIHVDNYYAFEHNKEILTVIRNQLRQSNRSDLFSGKYRTSNMDILEGLSKNKIKDYNFLNLDFCNALGSGWRPFMLPYGINRTTTSRSTVMITFNVRNKNIKRNINYAMEVMLQDLYDIEVVSVHKQTYKDTAAMCSWLYCLERTNKWLR